nr:glycosyltransferase family 2 protein [uncultured Devosia sp.]
MINPKVSVIIITWNSATIIGKCLEYLRESNFPWQSEVIVFDNASSDSTLDVVREFHGVTVFASQENLGFGRGNNAAALKARGEFLLLLNPDAYLFDPEALRNLVETAELEGGAAVGPKLLNTDSSHQVGDAGYSPSLPHLLAHQLFLSRFFRVKGYYVSGRSVTGKAPKVVDWLAGTCLLVRREIFAQSGFLADIFMYGEDVELGCRLTDAGHKLLYCPGTEVLHLQGATQKKQGTLYVSTKWIDSIFEHFRRAGHGEGWRIVLLKLILRLGFALRLVAYSAKYLRTKSDLDRARVESMRTYGRYVRNYNRLQGRATSPA